MTKNEEADNMNVDQENDNKNANDMKDNDMKDNDMKDNDMNAHLRYNLGHYSDIIYHSNYELDLIFSNGYVNVLFNRYEHILADMVLYDPLEAFRADIGDGMFDTIKNICQPLLPNNVLNMYRIKVFLFNQEIRICGLIDFKVYTLKDGNINAHDYKNNIEARIDEMPDLFKLNNLDAERVANAGRAFLRNFDFPDNVPDDVRNALNLLINQ